MKAVPEWVEAINHGTPTKYNTGACRCEFCKAAVRVVSRANRAHTRRPVELLEAIEHAAMEGLPIPEEARAKPTRPAPKSSSPQPLRRRSEDEDRATANSVQAATKRAHEARLRAVVKAESDVAKLALFTVAEYTDDDMRAIRYARIAGAL